MKAQMRVISVLAVFQLASLAARADDSYNLRRTPKAGEVDSYKTVLKVEGSDMSIEMTMATTETVKNVNSDGTYTIAATINSGEINLNGKQIPLSATGQTISSTYDRNGRILKQENTGAGRMNVTQLIALSRMGFAPEESLRIGQAKQYESEFGNERKQKITGAVTLLGIERASQELPGDFLKVKNVGDVKTAGADGEQTLHFDFLAYIDPKTGRLQKTDGKITGLKIGRAATTGTMTFTVNRIPPGAENK